MLLFVVDGTLVVVGDDTVMVVVGNTFVIVGCS